MVWPAALKAALQQSGHGKDGQDNNDDNVADDSAALNKPLAIR